MAIPITADVLFVHDLAGSGRDVAVECRVIALQRHNVENDVQMIGVKVVENGSGVAHEHMRVQLE